MQQQPGSDQELQVAVSKLAGQVEELTAMVAQLAAEQAGGNSNAKNINGAVLDGGAAVPAAPVKTAESGAKSGSKPLVRYGGGYAEIIMLRRLLRPAWAILGYVRCFTAPCP